MANRRKAPSADSSEKGDKKKVSSGRGPGREVLAVVFGCAGALTLLSLASYDARDGSLNASRADQVHNWIGPVGAYWADLALQTLGIGAFALGAGLLLAGARALVGKRVMPGMREAIGTTMLVFSSGTFAHLAMSGVGRSYPAGGIVGALLAELLREQLASLGAFIVAGALVLLALALTADGIVAGFGVHGARALGALWTRMMALVVMARAWYVRRAEVRAQLAAAEAEAAQNPKPWAWEEQPEQHEERKAKRKKKVEEAKAKGAALGEAAAVREHGEAKAAVARDLSEPEVAIDTTIDLQAEEEFSLGELPLPADDESPRFEVLGGVAADDEEPAIRAAGVRDGEAVMTADAGFSTPPRSMIAGPAPAENRAATAEEREAEDRAPIAEKKPRARKKTNEPEIVDVRPEVNVEAIAQASETAVAEDAKPASYELPPVSLLDYEAGVRAPIDPEKLRENAQRLVKTLKEYGIEGSVREIRPGPVVTMYEYVPAPGIKISKIAGLADDLAMSMAALRVRIVAPIPGKGAVGIEIPNESRETVYLKEIVAHDSFKKAKPHLTMAVGKDIEGNAYAANLAKMPHLLVAGATGTGKSVSINAMIMSILFKATPEQVRMIMVDPKMLELSVYEGIPHLLLPVVTDPKKAALALRWATEEMERRYAILSETGVRNIDGYNEKVEKCAAEGVKLTLAPKSEGEPERVCEPMPYIVVIVDELADLMMVASRDVEASIMRLAQMARAAGIHLILATQRPSVDVLTGVIKANFPTRIAFQVASKHDSRTIIDANGAEHLLGRGDMLYLSPGVGGIKRVHGAFVSDAEVERTVAFWKAQGRPKYDESILAARPEEGAEEGGAAEEKDEMYDQAVAIVAETRQASISMIQRRLRIGYNRAARLVEMMETQGIVGPADGAKPREVLVSEI